MSLATNSRVNHVACAQAHDYGGVQVTAEAVTPDVSTTIESAPCVAPAPRPAEVKPIAPERYKIQFTISREAYGKLRRAQDLLRHTVPNGDPTIIFERALERF
jgi:hypothetical protein